MHIAFNGWFWDQPNTGSGQYLRRLLHYLRKVDSALSPVVRILAMASEMAGGEDRAAIWFKHQPIPGWAGKTAYDLVREGKADKVLAYLEAVRSGVYA